MYLTIQTIIDAGLHSPIKRSIKQINKEEIYVYKKEYDN